MANPSYRPRSGKSAARTSRRPAAPLSALQWQAYFMARETIRRLKPSPTPCVARDVLTAGSAPPG